MLKLSDPIHFRTVILIIFKATSAPYLIGKRSHTHITPNCQSWLKQQLVAIVCKHASYRSQIPVKSYGDPGENVALHCRPRLRDEDKNCCFFSRKNITPPGKVDAASFLENRMRVVWWVRRHKHSKITTRIHQNDKGSWVRWYCKSKQSHCFI